MQLVRRSIVKLIHNITMGYSGCRIDKYNTENLIGAYILLDRNASNHVQIWVHLTEQQEDDIPYLHVLIALETHDKNSKGCDVGLVTDGDVVKKARAIVSSYMKELRQNTGDYGWVKK